MHPLLSFTLPSPALGERADATSTYAARGGGTGGRSKRRCGSHAMRGNDSSAGACLEKDTEPPMKAATVKQAAQQRCSEGDLGICLPQWFSCADDFTFTQQLAFSGGGTLACTGTTAVLTEKISARRMIDRRSADTATTIRQGVRLATRKGSRHSAMALLSRRGIMPDSRQRVARKDIFYGETSLCRDERTRTSADS